jgi:small nuclear ribonucleoprotein (snRNP)-like protein
MTSSTIESSSTFQSVVENQSESIDTIRSYLDKIIRLDLIDDRTVVGRFKCTDDEANIVLADAYEIRNIQDVEPNSKRKGNSNFVFINNEYIHEEVFIDKREKKNTRQILKTKHLHIVAYRVGMVLIGEEHVKKYFVDLKNDGQRDPSATPAPVSNSIVSSNDNDNNDNSTEKEIQKVLEEAVNQTNNNN